MINLIDKKIAVLGLGREGQALARYFAKENIDADFLDENPNADKSVIDEMDFNVIVGDNAFDNLNQYDLIFRSPGIAPHHPKLKAVKSKLTSLTRFFFEIWPGKIIGVTGTKGKGTTASIIKSILDCAKIQSILVGNIGRVDLENVGEFDNESYAVIELSSFQLMDLGASPHVAVVLDVGVEHLDYHKSVAEYVAAKLEIVKYQTKTDRLVITGLNPNYKKFKATSNAKTIEVYGNMLKSPEEKAVWWQNNSMCTNVIQVKSIITKDGLSLVGEHNKINAAAAAAAALAIGIDLNCISKAIKQFKNLPQRLENIGSFGGVDFINDSASTNPQTTIAAIKAFEKSIILIIGGKNKGLEYNGLISVIKKANNIKKVIVYGALSSDIRSITGENKQYRFVETLADAVDRSIDESTAGDIILLSPAAASFDQFPNYQVRGQKFNKLVYEHFNRKI